MVALYVERVRFRFMAVERTAGNAGNLLVVDGGDTVSDHCHMPADQSDIKYFPLPRLLRKVHRRSNESIDGAHAVQLVILLIGHLHFITTPLIDSAVSLVRAVIFNVQFVVLKLARGADIRTR